MPSRRPGVARSRWRWAATVARMATENARLAARRRRDSPSGRSSGWRPATTTHLVPALLRLPGHPRDLPVRRGHLFNSVRLVRVDGRSPRGRAGPEAGGASRSGPPVRAALEPSMETLITNTAVRCQSVEAIELVRRLVKTSAEARQPRTPRLWATGSTALVQ